MHYISLVSDNYPVKMVVHSYSLLPRPPIFVFRFTFSIIQITWKQKSVLLLLCMMLNYCNKEFQCNEAKIEESERPAITRSSPRILLAWATHALPLSHDSRTTTNLTILYMYSIGGTECLSHSSISQSVCANRTPVEFNQKIYSIRREVQRTHAEWFFSL